MNRGNAPVELALVESLLEGLVGTLTDFADFGGRFDKNIGS